MTTTLPTTIHPCRAREPRSCRFHGDFYRAEDYRKAADFAAREQNWDDFQTATDKAAWHQARWEATLASGVLDKHKSADTTDADETSQPWKQLGSPSQKIIEDGISISRPAWNNTLRRAQERNVTINYTESFNNKFILNVEKVTIDGHPEDVAYVHEYLTRHAGPATRTPFMGRGGPGAGGRDFTPVEMDTPTEHVGTIPTFEEFKAMFGFGRKQR